MSDSSGPTDDAPDGPAEPLESPDTFALAPQEPPPTYEPPLPAPPVDINEPPDDPGDRRFSLAELLGLVAFISVVLSVVSSIARCMGWADTPASLAGVFAVAFGVGTVIGMVFVAFSTSPRPIARVGLWVMLGGYFLCVALAAFLRK